MSIKHLLMIIVLGAAALVTARSFNQAFYTAVTSPLVLQIFSAPILTILLMSGEDKRNTVRVLVAIVTLTGIVGIVQIGTQLVRALLEDALQGLIVTPLVLHGLTSVIFCVPVFAWKKIQLKLEHD